MKNLFTISFLLISSLLYSQDEFGECLSKTAELGAVLRAQVDIEQAETNIRNQRSSSGAWPSVIIPVVFNIIHSGAAKEGGYYDWRSRQSCEDFINYANDWFSGGRNSDTQSNANITFVLADKDINGDPFDGYRTFNVRGGYTELASYIGGDGVYVAESSKDIVDITEYEKDYYLNVFIIDVNGLLSGWSWVPPLENRGLFLNSRIYRYRPTTFVHEIGHFLGLYHTFEGYELCSEALLEQRCEEQGDLVCDTGPTINFSQCTDACGIVDEQPNNFMSYSHTRCDNSTFTDGQIDRMHAVIQLYFSDMANHGQALYGTN